MPRLRTSHDTFIEMTHFEIGALLKAVSHLIISQDRSASSAFHDQANEYLLVGFMQMNNIDQQRAIEIIEAKPLLSQLVIW